MDADATEVEGQVAPADALLSLAPLTATRVLEVSAEGAFARGYSRLNPRAAATVVSRLEAAAPDACFDLVVLPGQLDAALWIEVDRRLSPGGLVLMADAGTEPSAGWTSLPGADGARRLMRSGEVPAPLHVHFRFMAERLMDIRTTLPAAALARDPALVVTTQSGRDPFTFGRLPSGTPKILVTQRPIAEEGWLKITAGLIRHGWISVVEYDDHPAAALGAIGRETSAEELNHFSLFHGVQTSTPALGDFFRRLNPEVALFPNAVFGLPPPPERSGPPKVFYGAIGRGSIGAEVAASLVKAAARFPEVAYVVVGDRAVFDALPSANKTFHPLVPYERYLALMRGCEIGLSPLEPSLGAAHKSDAKLLDAARNGVVLMASPTVYHATIVDGETGVIVPDVAGWDGALCSLLEDQERRRRIADQAWRYVRDRRMFAYQAAAERDWYQRLWARRHQLTAAMMDRSPALKRLLTGG